MSRSGYDDYDYYDDSDYPVAFWRAAVASAIRGRRGQAFLREMRDALDALPAKRLVQNELEIGGEVCALGAVGRARGIDLSGLDPEDSETAHDLAYVFNIAHAMVCEIVYENDEAARNETPEERYERMRRWVEKNLKEPR
jgi:hypothetical protein